MSQNALRQRLRVSVNDPLQETRSASPKSNQEEIVWGKTPAGEVFQVPTTHDFLTALFHPAYPKSHFDLVSLGLLALQVVLFFYLPRPVAKVFFFFYFVFWRAAYNAGLGCILTKQSKKKWIVREIQRRGWLDRERRPKVRNWIRNQLVGKMGKDYYFDDLPLEYNSWLLFRQVVDIILINDFLSYCMFAFSCFRVPTGLSLGVHFMRWIAGFAMIGFNLWVKTEAHDVVKDYGWYWGDVFFQRGALVFDGVFEFAPHPMYSVGYAGYYGLSLIVGSYPVLFVSLAGHAAQFGFLQFFENPHIERTYGQRKLLAQRIPLRQRSRKSESTDMQDSPSESAYLKGPGHSRNLSAASTSSESYPFRDLAELSTPAVTEGETATDSELDTETENENEVTPPLKSTALPLDKRPPTPGNSIIETSGPSRPTMALSPVYPVPASQHDLMNSYFRKDAILMANIDLLRTSDLKLILLISYLLFFTLLPAALSYQTTLTIHFVHSLSWCLFHSFGLGSMLRAQSKNKMLVRHFLNHYPYPVASEMGRGNRLSVGKAATKEAFENWKELYNLSLCMTYVSFIGLVWKTYSIPSNWTVGTELLRHTLGAALIGLHVWATTESFEVLGIFGWFYGDFFIEDFPSSLEYTGIYRYLNNPDVMNGAAFLGLGFISGSKWVFAIAVIKHLSQWWFLRNVENPHMRKLYGDSLRKEAGFVKVVKQVASKNAQRVAGKHAREIRRVAREVIGTFDKVYDETVDVVEEFLAKSKPKISEVVQETKVLLQQSRERLVITRVATDLTAYDRSKYGVSVISDRSDGVMRFHLGEEIKLNWRAPLHHSRKDWIGIYRLGANHSKLVTKTSSMGMWVPVHNDEWDGDIPLDLRESITDSDSGYAVFRGGALPWKVGKYEVRYHHDGKYNVMAIDGPIEIYVDKPEILDFSSIRACLKRIVPLCLDSDPSLIPLACQAPSEQQGVDDDTRDPDDFRFWSEGQARRICFVIRQIFDVEYTPEVIVADANLTVLANRILVSNDVLDS